MLRAVRNTVFAVVLAALVVFGLGSIADARAHADTVIPDDLDICILNPGATPAGQERPLAWVAPTVGNDAPQCPAGYSMRYALVHTQDQPSSNNNANKAVALGFLILSLVCIGVAIGVGIFL